MTRTKIEIFPKTDWSEEKVEQARKGHLSRGARSSLKSDTWNGLAWKVTTVWEFPDD